MRVCIAFLTDLEEGNGLKRNYLRTVLVYCSILFERHLEQQNVNERKAHFNFD